MFIVLAILLMMLPLAAAGSRQAGLAPGDRVLEPQSDGTYVLPISGMESTPLRFDPGEAPIELVALRIDGERDELVADLRSTADQPITAWYVRMGSVNAAGRETSAVTHGKDWAGTGSPRNHSDRSLSPSVLLGAAELEGPIQPGEIRTVDLGRHSGTGTDHLLLSIPVVVFEDTTYVGSKRFARDILENRSTGAEELARWLERIAEILDSTSGDAQLVAAVEELIAEMEAVERVPLQSSATAIRHTFQINLRAILDNPMSRLSKRAQIRALARSERKTLERKIEHVPTHLPEVDGPPRRFQPKTHFEGHEDDPVDGSELNCECGGSISTSRSAVTTIICDGSVGGWKVAESWPYRCLDESGSVTSSETRSLVGNGACLENSFCFPDIYCPPKFDGPFINEQDQKRVWTRRAEHYGISVGLCFTTIDCMPTGNNTLLTIECDCDPMPQPRCYADGCPILIEAGSGGFQLTGMRDGVTFDLTGHGIPSQVAWTVAGGDDAWLVLDRNGNGTIDDATELFGDRTPQPPAGEKHGFLALAVFDTPEHGGDGDGAITSADAIFDDLRLWFDHDHDGVTDLGELVPLLSADIAAIDLDFFRSERVDQHGNRFRYSTRVTLASGGHRLATDVFLQFE